MLHSLWGNHCVPDGVPYVRGMVKDLFPQPLSPLAASAGAAKHLDRAWTKSYMEAGLLSVEGKTRLRQRDVIGRATAVFGGHVYLNAALLGALAAQSTKADPILFTRQYAGGIAPIPGPVNSSWISVTDAERTTEWIDQILSAVVEPIRYREAASRLDRIRSGSSGMGESDEDIAHRITVIRDELVWAVDLYISAELAFLLSAEMVRRIAREAGNESLGFSMFTRVARDVLTPAEQLWNLAAQVERSKRLAVCFERMLRGPGSVRVTRAGEEGEVLGATVARLQQEYGHLGPGGWELSGSTWETDVTSLLNMIDQLRDIAASSDGFDMEGRLRAGAQQMNRDLAAVRRRLRGPRTRYQFERSFAAAEVWFRCRHKMKWIVSRLQHEQRLALHKLGRRHVDSGLLDDVAQIAMLECAEIVSFAVGAKAIAEEARMRSYDYAALKTYEVPNHVIGAPPPVVRWSSQATSRQKWRSVTYQSLSGVGASPGKGSGKGHIIRAGMSPMARFRAGDVLVVETSNSLWASLVPEASAVVVESGSPVGELALVCQCLGVPCVVSVPGAANLIPEDTVVSVDGSGGFVQRAKPARNSELDPNVSVARAAR